LARFRISLYIEAKIKWASIYSEILNLANSPFTSHSFQVRGSLDQYTSQGRTAQLPVVYLMTGVFKDPGTLTFHHHENVDTTSTVTVYHSELYVSGSQIHLYDVLANIFVVNGVDQLAQLRSNLGG